jgi:hypothetical protein
LWVFTDKRAQVLLKSAQRAADIEVRVPKEMLWVANRFGQGMFVLDVDAGAVWRLKLSSVFGQDGDVHYYQPRTLKYVTSSTAEFVLTCRPGRYDKEWAVIFAHRRDQRLRCAKRSPPAWTAAAASSPGVSARCPPLASCRVVPPSRRWLPACVVGPGPCPAVHPARR